MAIDWNKVIEQSLANAPLIIGASIAGLIKLRKLDHGQRAIRKQLDGHTRMLVNAKKAEGKYEGAKEAKKDLVDVVRTVKTVQKRQGRRDDK